MGLLDCQVKTLLNDDLLAHDSTPCVFSSPLVKELRGWNPQIWVEEQYGISNQIFRYQ